MKQTEKVYIAIDLKSFYASVECIERSLDPLTTNLVVADNSRTDKTICLAVSPSLKSLGVPGRPRLFEVKQKIKTLNNERLRSKRKQTKSKKSYDLSVLEKEPNTQIDFIIATPQMARYIDISSKIYEVYLKYVAPEDIHVYSIDEVFIDITPYLKTHRKDARDFTQMIVKDVYKTTSITSTAGIGSNLYLAKVAMDIVAKHMEEDIYGVRIAELDEISYRKLLWNHTPITDFWRVGSGYSKRLADKKMYTMGDIARCSLTDEDLLYDCFGINAELLIDHAWGYEPCTIKDIKAYKPINKTLGSGQVLHSTYTFEKTKIVVREMAEALALDLFAKKLVTDKVVLTLNYDIENLKDPKILKLYNGPVTIDWYGRKVPKQAHGTNSVKRLTSSPSLITNALIELYERIANPVLLIKKINISLVTYDASLAQVKEKQFTQLDFFTDHQQQELQEKLENEQLQTEMLAQNTVLKIKRKYGKNSILKASSLLDGATAIERNEQIGGHKK